MDVMATQSHRQRHVHGACPDGADAPRLKYNVAYVLHAFFFFFFFSSRRRHTRFDCDWSSDVCSSDLWRSGWCADPAAEWSCKSSGCRHSWTRDAASLSTAARGRNRNTRYVRASALGVVMKNRPVDRRTRRTSRNICAGLSTCSRTSVATTASNASSWNGRESALAQTIRTRSAVPGLRLDPLAPTAHTRSGRWSVATTSRPALSESVTDKAP